MACARCGALPQASRRPAAGQMVRAADIAQVARVLVLADLGLPLPQRLSQTQATERWQAPLTCGQTSCAFRIVYDYRKWRG